MKKIFWFVIFLFCMPAGAKVEVHFTPSSACEDSIVSLIGSANKTIDAAVYSINNNEIVRALKEAHQRGVKLRILTDKTQAGLKSSKVLNLYRYGINIKVNSSFKIEHNKFAIFDGQKVSTGSFNWTNPASQKNSENCLFVAHDSKTVARYAKRFNELWALNSEIKSHDWFERKKK